MAAAEWGEEWKGGIPMTRDETAGSACNFDCIDDFMAYMCVSQNV